MPNCLSVRLTLSSTTLFLVAALTQSAAPQNISVTASHIRESAGGPLKKGTICFVPTDSFDTPIQPANKDNTAAAAAQITRLCSAIKDGAIETMHVPDPASTPHGLLFRVTVKNDATGDLSTYRLVSVTGPSFSWDAYVLPPPAMPLGPVISSRESLPSSPTTNGLTNAKANVRPPAPTSITRQIIEPPAVAALTVNNATGGSYLLYYAGGDLCAQIAYAIAGLSSRGGIITVEGMSDYPVVRCSSNPFSENNVAPTAKPVTIQLGFGVISTTAQWLISTSHVSIMGAGIGRTAIRYVGSENLKDPAGEPGGIVEFYKPAGGPTNLQDEELSRLRIGGTDTYSHASPYGLLVTQVIHSRFHDLQVWGVEKAGIMEKGLDVMDPLDNVRVSLNEVYPGDSTVVPENGIVLMGKDDHTQSTQSTILNPIIEGVSGCGMLLGYTHGLQLIAGVIEQNATADLCVSTTVGFGHTQNLVVQGTDFEVTPASIIDNGLDDEYLDITTQNGGIATFRGFQTLIEGGQWKEVTVASEARYTKFRDVGFLQPPLDLGRGSTYTDPFYFSGDYSNSPFPWSYRDTTRVFVSSLQEPITNPKDVLRGVFSFPPRMPRELSDTPLTQLNANWKIILKGEWQDDCGGHAQNAAWIELSQSHPTYATAGGVEVTFSVNAEGHIQGMVSDDHYAEFIGEIDVIPSAVSSGSSAAIETQDAVKVGPVMTPGLSGPATAPTGSCSSTGQWVFSQDGHISFCAAGTWTTKI